MRREVPSLTSEGEAATPALAWSPSLDLAVLTSNMRMWDSRGAPPRLPQALVPTGRPPRAKCGCTCRSLSADYSLLLTFIYGGRVVGEAQVQSLDCRLVAEPSGTQCGMEQVVFPKPDPREPTQRLLSQIERGVLVASNSRGVFVQRLCPIPVSWNAPQAPPGPGPHLLPSNECVELFRTTYFCRGEGSPCPCLLPLGTW